MRAGTASGCLPRHVLFDLVADLVAVEAVKRRDLPDTSNVVFHRPHCQRKEHCGRSAGPVMHFAGRVRCIRRAMQRSAEAGLPNTPTTGLGTRSRAVEVQDDDCARTTHCRHSAHRKRTFRDKLLKYSGYTPALLLESTPSPHSFGARMAHEAARHPLFRRWTQVPRNSRLV